MRSVIGRSGKLGLRRLQPSQRETSEPRSSLPCSTSFITPMVVTILLTDATRTGSSGVTRRPDCGSAIPSAKLASSPFASNATPTAACTGGSRCGTVVQPARTRLSTSVRPRMIAYIAAMSEDSKSGLGVPTLEDWQHWTLVMGRAQQMLMEFWAEGLKKDQPFPGWNASAFGFGEQPAADP